MSRIVALHGNLGSADDWRVVPFRSECTAVDLWAWQERHPGLSLAEFGGRFADSVTDDAPPVLVGYSLGGRLTLQALLARPRRWRAAILISTHPGLESAEDRRARVETDAVWAKRARESDWVDFLADWNAQPVFAGGSAPPVPSQLALEPRREAIARAFECWSLGWQEPVDLGSVPCPVLWIAGEHDARFRALAEAMPGEKWIAPGCGHRVPWERPADLAQAIETFLRSLV
jgi:2-succinyl-6-hydroxy-2,4-cyclohexadiene-1-carboxylate synthase